MKPTRIFATASLIISSVALITAASISAGDEPGVVRMAAFKPQEGTTAPAPTPDPVGSDGVATMNQPPASSELYPQPGNYAPYFERSFAVTEAVPNVFYQPVQPFGPIVMFETNMDDGIGFNNGYQRVNARLPYHIIPNTNVLTTDLSASITFDGLPVANGGLVYRRYDDAYNRIFGVNAFLDYDQGYGNQEWYRGTLGFESLGRYVDFRANGYFMLGDDSLVLSDTLLAGLSLGGNNAFQQRQQVASNAYSGFDVETGGPIPLLGQYGQNLYGGAYYLTNNNGGDTVGVQARWEALITQNLTVNTRLTSDDTFGTNIWTALQYEIPNYKDRRILRPHTSVRERLQDPVYRHNRVHENIDTTIGLEALVNRGEDFNNNGLLDTGEDIDCDGILDTGTGLPYFLTHVDPNVTGPGTGTFEDPFSTLQAAALANAATIDIFRIAPRSDDSSAGLTVNGGITLFDNQILLSSIQDYNLGAPGTTGSVILGVPTTSNLGPLITNPTMGVGGSVIHLANNNRVIGMRIDGANAAGTIFGNGFQNALPITNTYLTSNVVTNYVTGADLQDVTGKVEIVGNTFTGLVGTSVDGLNLSAAAGSEMDLLLRNNVTSNNSGVGYQIIAKNGSTVEANDPDGAHCVTGIINNTANDNGTGMVLEAQTGATFDAVVDSNTANRNTLNGLVITSDGGTFNLQSLAQNTFNDNQNNGTFLQYRNGGNFRSVTEDLNGDGDLDVGEDVNGNGRLDQGIVSNAFSRNEFVGLSILGEDNGDGYFDIGGENTLLGNIFIGNTQGGIAADLQDTATGTINALNNSIFAFGRPSAGDVVRTGFGQNTLAGNDDLSTGLINPGFVMNFFGQVFNDLTVNNNGNVTFNGPLFSFTPFPLLTTATPMIAPFFADVDTRLGTPVTYGTGTVDGRQAFGVNYSDVRHFSVFGGNQGLPTNDFQLVLIDRSDVAAGDFDIEFNYERILWEAGTASGSDQFGLGGSTARVGWTNGVDRAFELPGSAVPGSFLDSGPAATSLVQNSLNSSTLGRYVFESRNGNITSGGSVAGSDGISVQLSDNATLQPSRFINNNISQSLGNGLIIAASDNATASNVVIQGNNINLSRANGIDLVANGPNASITAVVGGEGNNVLNGQSFAQGNIVEDNGTSGTGDGVRVLAQNGATVRGGILNNSLLDNGGNGIGINVDNGGEADFGTLANDRLISGNTIEDNSGAGISIISRVTASTEGEIDAIIRNNQIRQNAAGGIVSNLNGPNNNPPAAPLVPNNNRLNLSVGGPALTDANTIDGNGDVGIGVNVTGNGSANVTITNTTVTDTVEGPDPLLNGDGINLRRSDSALLTATLDNVSSTGNAGDGLHVETQGSDKADVNLPILNTPNTLTVTDSDFSENALNGGFFRTRGDSTLVGDITNSQFTSNGQNGIAIQTGENSSFGDPTIGLPPGRRSLFDGLVVEDNGNDGVQITATENSRALLEINSLVNATSISNNGGDGVHITTTGGRSDILITSGAATTTIDGNGITAGGNGVRWDARGTSEGVVRITKTEIRNSIAGTSEDTNNNGVLDAGEDLNNNGDIDVVDGDGIQASFSEDATATLIVGNVGEGNLIQNNEDDGIAITATGSDTTGNPRPIITITDNIIGGTLNGLQAGNGGDGVSLNVFGGTDVGISPGAVDNSITQASPQTDQFNGIIGVSETGAIPQFTMTENIVSNNNGRGVNIALTGASGRRDREFGNAIFDPVRIRLDDNTIVSNGAEGIFYRADSNMNQSRFVFLPNFPDPPFANFDNLNFSPFQAPFFNLNVGSVNGNTAYLAPYLNLRTVQNSLFTVTNNTIQNNGVNGVTGEGIRIEVGTGSYVAADITNNAMGGNLQEDLVTSSFLSAGNTFDSVDDSGDLTFDFIYLDDTAQLDMRFLNNSGNQLAPSDFGAVYTNADTLKNFGFFGPIGVTQREVALFQVDNGPNLNNPNNVFSNFGVTQDIQAAFTNGNYNIRAAADPAFPNLGFAPFLP